MLVFVYNNLTAYDDVHDTVQDLNLSSRKLIFIPVNDCNNINAGGGSHWSLLVYHQSDHSFYYYDSSGSYNLNNAKQLANKLVKHIKPSNNSKTAATVLVRNTPQQSNGHDCGCFVLANSHYLAQQVNGDDGNLVKNVNGQTAKQIRQRLVQILKEHQQ